ncbi:uncharacterized protein ACBT57_021240 [Dama dama]
MPTSSPITLREDKQSYKYGIIAKLSIINDHLTMIQEEFLVVEKPCDNADEKHYQKLIISDNGALFEDKSKQSKTEEQRKSRGQQAKETVTWPAQGREAPALDSRLPRHARPPPGTPASKPTPRARPTPAPKTRGHNCRQTPRAGHSETHLPRMRYTINGEYIMRNAGLEEAQAGIKIARRNINNFRYADDTTLMAESEEELKRLLMKVKEMVIAAMKLKDAYSLEGKL